MYLAVSSLSLDILAGSFALLQFSFTRSFQPGEV